ncbi:MAG: hypothetical protein ACXVAY_20160 [Mucilaginibacter sp.]
MKEVVKYILESEDEDRVISIRNLRPLFSGDTEYKTGVFSLHENGKDLGEIVFDDRMNQWEYTSLGNLTHQEAGQIAEFIKKESWDK